jgi:hypothetical protein
MFPAAECLYENAYDQRIIHVLTETCQIPVRAHYSLLKTSITNGMVNMLIIVVTNTHSEA